MTQNPHFSLTPSHCSSWSSPIYFLHCCLVYCSRYRIEIYLVSSFRFPYGSMLLFRLIYVVNKSYKTYITLPTSFSHQLSFNNAIQDEKVLVNHVYYISSFFLQDGISNFSIPHFSIAKLVHSFLLLLVWLSLILSAC